MPVQFLVFCRFSMLFHVKGFVTSDDGGTKLIIQIILGIARKLLGVLLYIPFRFYNF